jgi:signal transduction histidine kinase
MKLQVLVNICDSLSNLEKYAEEEKIARYGLSITPATDYHYLAVFTLYLGFVNENPDSVIYYNEKSLGYGRKSGNAMRVIEPLQRLLYSYNRAGFEKKRKVVASELQSMLDTARVDHIKSALYGSLGSYYESIGAYEKEVQYMIKDIEIKKEAFRQGKLNPSGKNNLGVSILGLAEILNNIGQPDKAVHYALESRPYLTGYRKGLSHFYKDITDAYLLLKKPDKAKVYYDSLTNSNAKDESNGWYNRIAIDLSFTEYYLVKKEVDSAFFYVNRANGLSKKWADEYLMSQVNYMTGKVYLARKEYQKALPLLKSSEVVCRDSGLEIYVSLLQSLAECYAETGKWQLSSEYYKKYAPLRDSLYKEASKKSLADAEGKYQNQEKQRQIELNNIQIDEAKKERIWLLSGLALLITALALLAVIYRNKRKNAEILGSKNQELAKLNGELEEANQTKAKLFSIISHDLRSPISQVYQFLKLQQLNPDLLNETQKTELSNKIQSATGSLLETMEDLLLWSKTQMNQFKTELQPVKPSLIVFQCQQLLQLNTEAKNLRVENHVSDISVVETDPYYLQTIVRNLLQNAIKASPQNGQIEINLIETENRLVALTIQNEGIPFNQQQYENGLAANDSSQGLSGLGLRLVDELSAKIGLKINFSNPSDQLTKVTITFP